MSILVNGQSQVPPGFRFHPTEEELLQYYLRKKVSYEKIDLDVIPDVDLNKLEPWDIQEKCKIGTTPQNDWYFFSHKDKKYPTGTRTNRATAAGFWKATGRDKAIHSNCKKIGMRKTLVFYKGRAPHGQKSDWIMHEYRLHDNTAMETHVSNVIGDTEEGWVVCRIFKKKNHHKTLDDSSITTSTTETTFQMLDYSCNDGALEHILQYMGRSFKDEKEKFFKLPNLESPNSTSTHNCYQPFITDNGGPLISVTDHDDHEQMDSLGPTNWATFDRLVASQLNGSIEAPKYMGAYNNYIDSTHLHQLPPAVRSTTSSSSNGSYHATSSTRDHNVNEIDLWSFARLSSSLSSSDPLCHVSDNSPI